MIGFQLGLGLGTINFYRDIIAPLTILGTPANATQDVPYTFTPFTGGGVPAYTYSISSGSLNAGLSLNTSTGVISGTPTVVATSSFTLRVTDSVGTIANLSTSIVVEAPAIQPYRIVGTPSRQADLYNGAVGANRAGIQRKSFYIGSGDATELVFSFSNVFATAGAATTGNSMTIIAVYIEKDGGVRIPVTFDGGSASKTLAWKDNDVKSDIITPAALGLSKFTWADKYWWTIHFSVPTSTDKFLSQYARTTLEVGSQGYAYDPTVVTPPTLSGGSGTFDITGLTANTNALPGPIVIGRHASVSRVFGGVGDSFFRNSISGSGSGNYVHPLFIFADNFERALVDPDKTSFLVGGAQDPTGVMAGINFGVYGSGIGNYDGTVDFRSPYYQYCTDIVCEYCTNDNAFTLAQLQAALSAIWTKYKAGNSSVRIWRTKFIPKTTSTDSFATVANQTYATNFSVGGKFDLLNQWFDTKQADGTIYAVCQMGRIRDPSDPWKMRVIDTNDSGVGVPGATSGDGTHPSGAVPVYPNELWSYIHTLATAVPTISSLVTTTSDTTLTASWTATGPVQDYLVEYKATSSGTWIPLHTYDYANGHCFIGLTPSTSYDVRITAWNYLGYSNVLTSTLSTQATPSSLVLDTLSKAITGAYSTRRVRASWTDAGIRVRRDRDGLERNIYFDSSHNMDIVALQTFVGPTGSGRLKRRNDQTGNTKHVQGSYSSSDVTGWPMIIVSGTPYTVNSKIVEYYNGAKKLNAIRPSMGALSPNPTKRSFVAVIKCDSFTAQNTILGGSNSGYFAAINTTGKLQVGKRNSTTLITSTGSLTVNQQSVVAADWDGSVEAAFIDRTASGTASVASVTMASAAANSVYAATNTGDSFGAVIGFVPEVFVLDEDNLNTSDRQLLENSSRTYWNTP